MAVKTHQDLRSPLFLGVDTQLDGSVIVTCDKSLKDEAEAFLSHLAIYLEQIFGVVIWEAFTNDYKESMSSFAYCNTKQCAVEITADTPNSTGSSIASDDSANLNSMLSRFGLDQHIESEDNWEFPFDLTQQVSLHIGADCSGILGDAEGDSGTVRTDCSAATLATTKAYLEPPINYLLVSPVTLNEPTPSELPLSHSQAADQLPDQPLNQPQQQPPHQSTSQPQHPDNHDPSLSQQHSSPTAPSTVQGHGPPTAESSAATSLATATTNDRLQAPSDG